MMMIRFAIVLIVSICVLSCIDNAIYSVCLDRRCPDYYEDILKSDIKEMNRQYRDFVEDELLIEYDGWQQYNITDIDTIEAKNDHVNVVVCSYETGDVPLGHGVEGADIMLYVEVIPEGWEEMVLFHELGHFVGMGHAANEESVMYAYLYDQEYPWFLESDWMGIK